jgi:hypothetical protein
MRYSNTGAKAFGCVATLSFILGLFALLNLWIMLVFTD